jgi:hypothetical protein
LIPPGCISIETRLFGIERRVPLWSILYGVFKTGNALVQTVGFNCLEQDPCQVTSAVSDPGIEFASADLVDCGTQEGRNISNAFQTTSGSI